MLNLLLVINLFVNPEAPRVETKQMVVYTAPVDPTPVETDRRCTREESNACYAACAKSELSASCVVRTDWWTGKLTRFCYCYDINLYVEEEAPESLTCQR